MLTHKTRNIAERNQNRKGTDLAEREKAFLALKEQNRKKEILN